MIAFFIAALLVGQAQSIFFNRLTGTSTNNNAIQNSVGQVCVNQPGVANSLACVPCAFQSAVQCANTNFFNGANSRYLAIRDQGQVNETVSAVTYFCSRAQVMTCTGMMNLANGAELTRAQLQCVRTTCTSTLQVFFRLANVRIQIQSGLNIFQNLLG